MNREILFRGKSVDNGEWIYGDWMNYADTAQIWYMTEEGKWNALVIPETHGQYTGLTDKNGKRIFEGDILDLSGYMIKDVGVVKFGEYKDNDMTDDYPCGHVGFYVETKEQYYARKDILFFVSECKVVGNIHDNPELLEEG